MNVSYVVTSNVTCSDNIITWANWNQDYINGLTTATSSIISDSVWIYWNQGWVPGAGTNYQTSEEIAAQTAIMYAAEAERQARQRVASRAREESRLRAEELLLQNLDKEQAAQFQRERAFEVYTQGRTKRYRVGYGTAGNVSLLDGKGVVVAKFCIHPEVACPTEDVMLAQKLLLETDEGTFLKIANRTPMAA